MQCPQCSTEVPFRRVVLVHLRLGGGRCGHCKTPFEPIFSLRACINMGLVAAALFGLVGWLFGSAWWLLAGLGVLGFFTGAVLAPATLVQIRVYPLKRRKEGPSWMRSASGR